MLNVVPYNVNVPEFQPERKAPIFPQITRKYPCQENVVGSAVAGSLVGKFDRLTWKIQQPDQTMVWSSVKLVLPLVMQAVNREFSAVDMRATSRLPSCNIAVAESPMKAFRQTQLTINGRMFSEVNDYRRVLDACYSGLGPSAYGDNHSLKPIVSRNMISPDQTRYIQAVTMADPPVPVDDVQINVQTLRTLDNSFNLLEHNGPFLERARRFQDQLSDDGLTWQGEISSYLELGPFQSRARRGNTAVPFIRDFHLLLNFLGNESAFDATIGSNLTSHIRAHRVVPQALFEFGTPSNLRHFAETAVLDASTFISGLPCYFTAKPYLEITYTRYMEAMKPYYNLRCFERQYEQSNRFTLRPQLEKGVYHRTSEIQLARVTSRVLAYPTKIYLYCDYVDTDKDSWIFGGCRRSCSLKNIHCRINQRPDVIFNPSQEACFEMFQRHTNSSLEFAAWLKSPIYVFDPVDLGQSDMFANDARLSVIEWDAECSLTALQCQEVTDALNSSNLASCGYIALPDADREIPVPLGSQVTCEWDWAGGSSSKTCER